MRDATDIIGPQAASRSPESALPVRRAPGIRRRARLASWGALLCGTWLTLSVLAALFAPWLTPYPQEGAGTPNMANKLLPPSPAHPLGADAMGRDVLARLLYGGRTALGTAAIVVGSSMVVGILLGLAAGFHGGWVDETAMRVTDVFLAFPPLLLAILLLSILGGGYRTALLALSLTWWPLYAQLVRGQVLAVRHRPFVEAARATGVHDAGIMVRHILPNALMPLVVQATVDVGAVILVAAGLSFIGLGPEPPMADWGVMIADGRQHVLSGQWWVAGAAGAAITFTALACALLGDSLRDARRQP